ncbi:hypothetical protein C8A03DRAFT_43003 [Achaetomium macrosporum]|uniref:Kelch repeat-containing protein n=1 Tax=Achaetomium macrosporum TaxID=79813 RepID=A0AAN7CD76_9PEZI|nr:hypothetical protein C8A03DRAFT_43003 [Achaetomium macrosporum]
MRFHRSLSRLLPLLGLGCVAGAQFSDVPSLENFYRRGGASATMIGNYVYFDGGEVSQALDGKAPGEHTTRPVNSTISIDISKSWTTSDVVLRTIDRPWSSKINQVIWTNYDAAVFYVWAGRWFGGNNMTANELWKFTPDSSGGGSWALETPANPELLDGLEQAEYMVFANDNDTGFAIGGVANGWTRKGRLSDQAIPGMVAFAMKTKSWYNLIAGLSPILQADTLAAGAGHYIPNFGPSGLIMALGGVSHPVDAAVNWDTARAYDFRNLTFFDPQTRQTYWQRTTGDIPPSPRSQFCLAGFQNSEGGYEMIVMGGYDHRDKILYKDTYILSLPGFVWITAPDSPTGARRTPACVSVGNRQLLMIGGTAVGGWENKDTAPQGLALFDMTEMKWKDSYDANAAV